MTDSLRPILLDIGITGLFSRHGGIDIETVENVGKGIVLLGVREPTKGKPFIRTTWVLADADEEELVLVLRKKEPKTVPVAG